MSVLLQAVFVLISSCVVDFKINGTNTYQANDKCTTDNYCYPMAEVVSRATLRVCFRVGLLISLVFVALGGLGVTCSPRDPRFAGSNPAEVDGEGDFKSWVPSLRFQAR